MISYYIWFGFMLFLFGFGCGSALYLFTYLGNRKLTYLAEVEIKNAIKNSLENGITIITGGPGTGKTTIINSILNILEDGGLRTHSAILYYLLH